ncbi:MAG: dihydrofolate reductase family protein [Dehalococcoidia bacterium]
MQLARLAEGSRPYLEIEFPAAGRVRPYIIVNMVASIDGKAVIGKTEQGLGSKEDKARMQELRAQADAVMNGATTLRTSGASSRVREQALQEFRKARGKAAQPLGVLVTSRGDFEMTGPYFDGSLECVVLASKITKKRAVEIEARGPVVVSIPEGPGGLATGLGYLRKERGVELLLCEGGPTLNASLLEAGVIDEWFQTVGPRLVGGRDRITPLEGKGEASAAEAEPLSAIYHEESGELYLRYRLRH